MDTRQRDRKINYYAKKYWTGRDNDYKRYSAYSIAQDMKKAEVCKHDMDCYRLLLKGVERQFRDKSA